MSNRLILGVAVLAIGLLTTTAVYKSSNAKPSKEALVQVMDSSPTQNEGGLGITYKVKDLSIDPDNTLVFNTAVLEETVDEAIAILDKMDGDTIYLEINSPGGSVFDGTRLVNYIKYSNKKIVTICNNICASMGFQLFEVGKERLMVDKAILMAHPASGGAMGTIENMYTMLKMIKLYVDRLDYNVVS